MPGMNGSGPTGSGAMSGGGRGVCMSDDPAVVRRFVERDSLWRDGDRPRRLGGRYRGSGRDFGVRRHGSARGGWLSW